MVSIHSCHAGMSALGKFDCIFSAIHRCNYLAIAIATYLPNLVKTVIIHNGCTSTERACTQVCKQTGMCLLQAVTAPHTRFFFLLLSEHFYLLMSRCKDIFKVYTTKKICLPAIALLVSMNKRMHD